MRSKGHRGARIVELQDEARVDDHLVFGAHRSADGADQVLFALVIFVLAIGNDARRRRDRQERLGDVDALESCFEIVDVALQLRLSRIGDRAGADRLDGGGDTLARIEFGIELGEFLAINAARERIGAGFDRPPLEARQPFQHILRPADRFAEFAVADDIDADLGLLPHHLGDRIFEAIVIAGMIVGFARLFGAQEFLQRRRPDQAADMRGENTIAAALHYHSSLNPEFGLAN